MNKSKRYDYEETQRRIECAHQRATGDALGDVKINLLVKQNAWLLSDHFNNELKAYNLSCVSYFTLMMLYSTPHNLANPSDICLCTGETRANMTRICDELVEQGFVKRIPSSDDRRRVDLSLTENGIELLKTVAPALHERVEAVFSVFDASEKATLETLLLKLMRSLETKV